MLIYIKAMSNNFGYCEGCYKRIVDIADIYVRDTSEGNILYCLKCKEAILKSEKDFKILCKVYNIDTNEKEEKKKKKKNNEV